MDKEQYFKFNAYKEHAHQFKSTTIRNESVWNMISNEIGYTLEQCKNKFNYLKSKYIKKKENMSDKATGAKVIHFEYFEEFEELFGNAPNVTPVTIASSSSSLSGRKRDLRYEKENEIGENSGSSRAEKSDSENENKEFSVKRRKLNLADQLKKLTDEAKEKEKNKERRHREILEQRERTLTSFNKCLTFIMEKEKKSE